MGATASKNQHPCPVTDGLDAPSLRGHALRPPHTSALRGSRCIVSWALATPKAMRDRFKPPSSRPPSSDPRRSAPPSSARGRPPGKFTQHKRMSELRRLLIQHPKGVTLSEIAGHLHVTERSARRYLAELNFDIESEVQRPSGQKRWRIPAVDLPRRVALRRTQAYALLAATPLFEPLMGSTLYEEIELAAQTLLAVARRPGRGPNAGVQGNLEQRFRYVPFAPKNYTTHIEELDALFEAVADLRPLSCRYPGAESGKMERIVVHPLALVLYKGAVYCLARAPESGAVRTLLLDAIRSARTVDGERFTIPKGFSLDDYVQGQFGLWRSDAPPHEVVIRLDRSVADYVLSRTVHPTQRVAELEDGDVELTFDIADLTEVTTWVLGFGSLATVVAPEELRARVCEELRRTLAHYS